MTSELEQMIARFNNDECNATKAAIERRKDALFEEMRLRWCAEAAALGLDVEQVIGGRRGKRRGAKRNNGQSTAG